MFIVNCTLNGYNYCCVLYIHGLSLNSFHIALPFLHKWRGLLDKKIILTMAFETHVGILLGKRAFQTGHHFFCQEQNM